MSRVLSLVRLLLFLAEVLTTMTMAVVTAVRMVFAILVQPKVFAVMAFAVGMFLLLGEMLAAVAAGLRVILPQVEVLAPVRAGVLFGRRGDQASQPAGRAQNMAQKPMTMVLSVAFDSRLTDLGVQLAFLLLRPSDVSALCLSRASILARSSLRSLSNRQMVLPISFWTHSSFSRSSRSVLHAKFS